MEPLAVPELVPKIVGVLAALVALMMPPDAIPPFTVWLPATLIVVPLWLTIESPTLELPALLENSGMKPVLQAVVEEQTISFACSMAGGFVCAFLVAAPPLFGSGAN